MKHILLILACVLSLNSYAQTVQDLINEVNTDNLMTVVKELSGEKTAIVNGEEVTIKHRRDNSGNDLATEYLLEKFKSFGNLEVKDDKYSSQGRNVIAIQKGSKNPDDIYLVCAHFDTVTSYGADDNASGTSAILELARILSQYCVENTIVYALWDEEEEGMIPGKKHFKGSGSYAEMAKNEGLNLLAVYNMDMMAYDNNNDTVFDIDYNDNFGANGKSVKDDIVSVLNTYKFNLKPKIVSNSDAASDNKSFWHKGFNTVLVGESWATNDRLPNSYYHKVGDKTDKFNKPYYFELSKLAMAYFATKAVVVNINNNVTQDKEVLTAQYEGAQYQWIDCDTDLPISDATSKVFKATKNGKYAVKITEGDCSVMSACYEVTTLSVESFKSLGVNLFPNPMRSKLNIQLQSSYKSAVVNIVDVSGKTVLKQQLTSKATTINVSQLAAGVYFAKLNIDGRLAIERIIKEK